MHLHTLPTGTLDLARARFVRADGRHIRLTAREADLLHFLVAHAGEDVARDQLRIEVFGAHEDSLSRAVDSTVARLRRKIEVTPAVPEVLCTVHGLGYRLVTGAPAPPAAAPPAPAPLAPPAPTPEVPRPPSRAMRLGPWLVDLDSGVVRGGPPGARPWALTAQERRILDVLAARPGQLVDAPRLARLARVDGGADALPNAIWRLRSRLGDDARAPRCLHSVRGAGYRLVVDEAQSRAAA